MDAPAHFAPEPSRPARGDHLALKVVGAISAALIALIFAAYIAGCVYFSNHLWPNTSAIGIDLSLATQDQAARALESQLGQISVRVTGDGVDFTLDPEQTGISRNSSNAASAMAKSVNPLTWPVNALGDHDESSLVATTFDVAKVRDAVSAALAPYNASATAPVDASLTFDQTTLSYRIDPGTGGNLIDAQAVSDLVVQALERGAQNVRIDGSVFVPQSVAPDDGRLVSAMTTANGYLSCDLDFTLNGKVVQTLDASVVKDWVSIGDDYTVTLDDAQLAAFADRIENAVDDVGEQRTYTRPDGKTVTVSGGTYGWISNGDLLDAMVRDTVANGYTGQQEIPCKQTAAVYLPGGQDWGSRYIDVDLTEQHVRMYGSDGALVWESDCVSGSPSDGHSTPTGVYMVNTKATGVTLIGKTDPATGEPEYRTPVSYWMPFVGNSVGLHDASWQAAFGGTRYLDGYGSHGCVNLPSDKAAQLYQLVSVGDVVVVHS